MKDKVKLIIEIPTEQYNRIVKAPRCVDFNEAVEDRTILLKAIQNGSLLPKRHGKLIDADEYMDDIACHYFDNSTVIRCTEIALENAPAIVEADGDKE